MNPLPTDATIALMYHAVGASGGPGGDPHYAVDLPLFTMHLQACVHHGGAVVCAHDWLDGRSGVIVTFDDGHQSNHRVAWPALAGDATLHVLDYDVPAPFLEREISPSRLVLPLKQSAGAPCLAKVKAGDRVSAGQLIAEPAANALGATLHAPLAGTVREITNQRIVLER